MSQDVIETRAAQILPLVCRGLPIKHRDYPGSLLPKLKPWHAYVADAGHCVFAILQQHEADAFASGQPEQYLIPMPVKSVLRGFETREGFILSVAGDLEYHPALGLRTPEGDNEY